MNMRDCLLNEVIKNLRYNFHHKKLIFTVCDFDNRYISQKIVYQSKAFFNTLNGGQFLMDFYMHVYKHQI